MAETIDVHLWWKTAGKPVDEGRYNVVVDEMTRQGDGRIKGIFQILDEGSFSGRRLYETFNLDREGGQNKFKQLAEVLGIKPQEGRIELSTFKHSVLQADVFHNEGSDGKTYYNVGAYYPGEE